MGNSLWKHWNQSDHALSFQIFFYLSGKPTGSFEGTWFTLMIHDGNSSNNLYNCIHFWDRSLLEQVTFASILARFLKFCFSSTRTASHILIYQFICRKRFLLYICSQFILLRIHVAWNIFCPQMTSNQVSVSYRILLHDRISISARNIRMRILMLLLISRRLTRGNKQRKERNISVLVLMLCMICSFHRVNQAYMKPLFFQQFSGMV